MITREQVYSALFANFSALQGAPFMSVSRQLRHVDDVDMLDMPALYQNQLTETPWNQTLGGGVGTIIEVQLYIYAPSDQENPNTVPSQLLNPCVDAVTALFPSPTRTTQILILGYAADLTLGKVEYFEGLLEKKSIATMQVYLRVPFTF